MRRVILALCCLAILGVILPGAIDRSGAPQRQLSTPAPAPASPSPVASPGWLGLNGNTSSYLGPIDTFSRAGVVFDRNFELQAGAVPGEGPSGSPEAEFAHRLAEDHALGMSPVAVIEYDGYGRAGYEFQPDPRFPHGASIAAYVTGFVRTAVAIRALAAARYPGMEVRFEVMNEPWGETNPQYDGGDYAHVVAALIGAATAAGIPGRDIYVAATGAGCSPAGCRANGWVREMYLAEPALRRQVEGWYLHPYGPPVGVGELANGGIQAVPLIRSAIESGRGNLIVSEVGFCAREVNNPGGAQEGVDCHGAPVVSSADAAAGLTATLKEALPYHREGWLRALIVYSRNDGGWAMQLPGGTFTASGRALLRFAESAAAG